MNKKALWIYFYLFSKRQLKKVSFWIILLIFPVFTFFFSHVNTQESTAVQVALFSDATDGFPLVVMDKLQNRDGIIQFYICSSSEELYHDVVTGQAECGYIISEHILEKLDNNQRRKLIEVVVSPSTTMSKIVNEVVYSELFEEYTLHLLLGYITNKSVLSGEASDELLAEAEELYRLHMVDGSTFSFAYSGGASDFRTSYDSLLLTPIRGLIAVLIFLSGFCGTILYYNDMENHIYDNRNQKNRQLMLVLSVSVSVLLSCIPGLLCLYLSGIFTSLPRELPALLLYAVLVTAFCSLLGMLIKKKVFFCSLIPVFMLASLLFTPVFIDVTLLLPILKPVSRLLVPYYYLWFF